ncbi:coiled-coil domain-containing protein 172-like isoform X1 [Engraulis encrasicolus]|uniref:coiled-coil domain-containing protein 172-like isoform X1 n=1 Tax=Engraulis encrasicolus TaxID=184585 RepID=UPI002FD675FF
MSLDTFFKQILLTEQQVSENCRKLQEAKFAIANGQEQVKVHKEQLDSLTEELNKKGYLLTELTLQRNLLKQLSEELESRRNEIQLQQQRFRDDQETLKNWEVEEQKAFLAEVRVFNSENCVLSRRHTARHHKNSAEMIRVTQEAHDLCKDLEAEVKEAVSLTTSLKAEKMAVSRKPLEDKLCLRLKEEVGLHKEENLLLQHQHLSAKIQLLEKVKDSPYEK